VAHQPCSCSICVSTVCDLMSPKSKSLPLRLSRGVLRMLGCCWHAVAACSRSQIQCVRLSAIKLITISRNMSVIFLVYLRYTFGIMINKQSQKLPSVPLTLGVETPLNFATWRVIRWAWSPICTFLGGEAPQKFGRAKTSKIRHDFGQLWTWPRLSGESKTNLTDNVLYGVEQQI